MEGKDITKAVSTAVAIVVLAVIAALVVGAILDSGTFSQGDITGINTNESLGVVDNVTNVTFAIISTQPTAVCNFGALYNATGGELIIGTGNYTFYTDCKLILQDDSPYVGETLNATYEYVYTGEGSQIINVADIKEDFGEFIAGLLGFLGIIGIIIGVIWLVMYVAKLFAKEGLNNLGQTA